MTNGWGWGIIEIYFSFVSMQAMTTKAPSEAWKSCEKMSSSDRWAILAHTIKLLSATAIACTLSLNPQKATAEAIPVTDNAEYTIPTYTALWGITALSESKYNQLVDSFITSINWLPQRWDTEIINGITATQILQWIKYSWNLENLFDTLIVEFRNNGWDAIAALEKLYRSMDDIGRMAAEHSEAIWLGRQNFITNTLLHNPSYTEWRLQRAPEEVKIERAWASFDHTLQAILRNDPEVLTSAWLTRFVQYTREFTEAYLMSDIFAGDFPQEYLARAIRIAELDQEIAESAQRTAESAQRTDESAQRTDESAQRTAESAQRTAESAQRTAELQAEISAEFRKMADTIRERRLNN